MKTNDSQTQLLIVEDDADLLASLAEQLSHSYEVLTAPNGEEGYYILQQEGGQIDILITDLKMPRMSGLQLIKRAKELYPALQIIVITGFELPQINLEDREVITYLKKPFTSQQLEEQIKNILTQKKQHGFEGSLQGFELVDIIQLYCLSNANAALTVVREAKKGKEKGNIYFEKGQITNAISGDKRGEDAFYYIMSWDGGKFYTRYGVLAKRKEISASWHQLVVEALRLKDEQNAVRDIHDTDDVFLDESEEFEEQTEIKSLSNEAKIKIETILRELKDSSDNLESAIFLDNNGDIIAPVKNEKTEILASSMEKIANFSQKANQTLDIGILDEVIIVSQKGLVVLFPVEEWGIIGVSTPSPNLGMIRWNCNDALESIVELISLSYT